MDQSRWKTVNRIFHAALELTSDERAAFVQTASNGDPDLQAEVEHLLRADEQAGSYLESPLLPGELFSNPPSPVSEGDVLCGRFRILRSVGEGGMGHVFEAFDSELTVNVALKIIRPEIASNPEALARFRQEVRLARRITHPNVCRTFDIERGTRVVDPSRGTKQEIVFLTMEFLDGETLSSRIKRTGPIPLQGALEIARQVANALDAASTLGVVHRDIKPGNIMLVPVPSALPGHFRAVIMDFGLARLGTVISPGNRSTFSQTGRPIGTLAYMAPEQLENGQVSPQTDIYAFGLVLFEMVTGQRAFPSEDFLSGIAQRLASPSPLPRSIAPDVPGPWRLAIEGCLRTKPSERFQSAGDVIAVLDGGKVQLPPVKRRRLLSHWPEKRWIAGLGAALLVFVTLLAGGLRLYRLVADSKVDPGALVYLTQVRNQTGEGTFDNLTELIHAGLAQSARINLLDEGRAGDILEQMTKAPDTPIDAPIAREIAMRAGAVRVVFANVTGSGDSYQLNVDIQQPDATSPSRYRAHWARSFPWRASNAKGSSGSIPPELLNSIRTASDWIRLEVGESANDIARLDAPPEDVTTSNWNALAAYAESYRFTLAREPENAVVALHDAIKDDPRFALAYARLGDVLVSLDRTVEGYCAYTDALDPALDQRLTRRERDRIRGMFAIDTGDFQAAEDAFRDYSAYFENDYLGWAYRSYPLKMLGRTDEAISVLRSAIAIDPQRSFAPSELASYLLIEGEFDEAGTWIQQLRNHHHPESALFVEGPLFFLEFKFGQAAADFQQLIESPDYQSRSGGYALLARLYAEQGNDQQATAILNRGISEDRAQGNAAGHADKLLDRAYLECRLQQFDACIDDLRTARNLHPTPQVYLAAGTILGESHARAHGEEAAGILQELVSLEKDLPKDDFGVITDLMRIRTRAETLLATGKTRAALAEFRRADRLDAPAGQREYLARALLIAAGSESNSQGKRLLQEEALTAYGAMALKPGMVWQRADEFPPGFLTDEMVDYLQTAGMLYRSDAGTKACEGFLKHVRGDRAKSEATR